MNPFHDKSPAEFLVVIPDLADPELDALAAAVCDGDWIELNTSGDVDFWQMVCLVPNFIHRDKQIWCWTTMYRQSYFDPCEAMRLLVKYRLSIVPQGIAWWCRSGIEHTPIHQNTNPCRAIIEAAVVCELTRMIEGEPCTANEN